MQWTWIAANNWGSCHNGARGMGCGPQVFEHNNNQYQYQSQSVLVTEIIFGSIYDSLHLFLSLHFILLNSFKPFMLFGTFKPFRFYLNCFSTYSDSLVCKTECRNQYTIHLLNHYHISLVQSQNQSPRTIIAGV